MDTQDNACTLPLQILFLTDQRGAFISNSSGCLNAAANENTAWALQAHSFPPLIHQSKKT
jgi:hypothetical protein